VAVSARTAGAEAIAGIVREEASVSTNDAEASAKTAETGFAHTAGANMIA